MSVRQSPLPINGTLKKVPDQERLRLQKAKEGETLSSPVPEGWSAGANAYPQV